MKLLETTLTETTVRLRYADHSDPAKAVQWIDFQVSLEGLTLPLPRGSEDLGDDPNTRILAEVRLAALLRARALIAAESQHFESFRGPRHP